MDEGLTFRGKEGHARLTAIVDWIVPPKIHVHPGPQNVTLFGNRLFRDVMTVRMEMRSYWIKVSSKSDGSVLIRNKKDTQRHRWCEDGGRDWSDASTSQRMPRTADQHQKQGERPGTVSPSEPPEGVDPANILISDFWHPQLWENNSYCFKPPSLWSFVWKP